jgi:hypothetical protein
MKTIEPRKFSRNCTECKKARPNSFCDLPEPIFRKLSDLMICRRYTRGTAVFIEGQPPKGVYVYAPAAQSSLHIPKKAKRSSCECRSREKFSV